MNEETAVRRSADLALVDAAVARLTRVDLECPILVRVRQTVGIAIKQSARLVAKVRLVNGPESLVGRVSVRGHRQQAADETFTRYWPSTHRNERTQYLTSRWRIQETCKSNNNNSNNCDFTWTV